MRFPIAAAVAAMLVAAPVAAQSAEAPSAGSVAVPDEAMPQPPAGAAIGFAPPERDEAGYRTPNRDLIAAQAVWHVRVAFNVAALGCRGAGDEALDAAYNAWLAAERTPLADALAATRVRYQAASGSEWERRFEDDMTRLYNFFAQPPVHARFCATAATLLREAQGLPPEDFAAFARAALPRLEAPFLAFFAAYDDYRGALANWRERHAPVVLATAAVPPVGPAVAVAMRRPAGPDGD